jgi:hypothetical protein
LTAEEIEFMRWKAERWMKLRHYPTALAHDPLYVIRNTPRMMRHTFRGSTWRTALGLEHEREAFKRYRRLREQERDFLADVAVDNAGASREMQHAPRTMQTATK